MSAVTAARRRSVRGTRAAGRKRATLERSAMRPLWSVPDTTPVSPVRPGRVPLAAKPSSADVRAHRERGQAPARSRDTSARSELQLAARREAGPGVEGGRREREHERPGVREPQAVPRTPTSRTSSRALPRQRRPNSAGAATRPPAPPSCSLCSAQHPLAGLVAQPDRAAQARVAHGLGRPQRAAARSSRPRRGRLIGGAPGGRAGGDSVRVGTVGTVARLAARGPRRRGRGRDARGQALPA